jgi:F0F1-type ATP synthase assembly protein I
MSLIGPEGRRQLQLAARFLTAGLELAVTVVLGYLGGRWLDGRFGTTYVAYLGLLLGIVAGFRNLFSLARGAQTAADSPEQKPEDPDNPGP